MSRQLYQAAHDRMAQEEGTVHKDWGGRIPVVLAYANVYPVGMANLGFLTVYDLLNRHSDVVCERVLLPDWEERALLERTGTRLFSLESQRPVARFEMVAFSFSYENDYANAAAMLALSGIPAEKANRTDEHPLIVAGGPAVFLNPEPMADVVDAFILGEAEEVLEEFLERYRQSGRSVPREAFLRTLVDIEGVYVPSLYRPRYDGDGTLAAFEPIGGAPATVRRRWVKGLDAHRTVAGIRTPQTEFSGIDLVEVGRGCSRRCRFCSTGFIYSPVRYRKLETLKPSLSEGIRKGLRLGLVCAALGDYPEMVPLCRWLSAEQGALSAPSLRVDALSEELLTMLQAGGQKTVTLAPEGGTLKMRRTLNKPFSDEQILDATDRLAAHGIFGLRLYFMVGLPGETDDDVDGIIDLVKRLRHRYLAMAKGTGRMGEISLSVNPFVPKPWSPFQWCAMAGEGVIKDRLKRIRRALQKEPNIAVTHGLAKWAFMQALFTRGDRRVGRFVLAGAKAGTDWKKVFRQNELNPDFFVYRERAPDERFPWDFIDQGVSKDTLLREYEKRFSGGGGDTQSSDANPEGVTHTSEGQRPGILVNKIDRSP